MEQKPTLSPGQAVGLNDIRVRPLRLKSRKVQRRSVPLAENQWTREMEIQGRCIICLDRGSNLGDLPGDSIQHWGRTIFLVFICSFIKPATLEFAQQCATSNRYAAVSAIFTENILLPHGL